MQPFINVLRSRKLMLLGITILLGTQASFAGEVMIGDPPPKWFFPTPQDGVYKLAYSDGLFAGTKREELSLKKSRERKRKIREIIRERVLHNLLAVANDPQRLQSGGFYSAEILDRIATSVSSACNEFRNTNETLVVDSYLRGHKENGSYRYCFAGEIEHSVLQERAMQAVAELNLQVIERKSLEAIVKSAIANMRVDSFGSSVRFKRIEKDIVNSLSIHCLMPSYRIKLARSSRGKKVPFAIWNENIVLANETGLRTVKLENSPTNQDPLHWAHDRKSSRPLPVVVSNDVAIVPDTRFADRAGAVVTYTLDHGEFRSDSAVTRGGQSTEHFGHGVAINELGNSIAIAGLKPRTIELFTRHGHAWNSEFTIVPKYDHKNFSGSMAIQDGTLFLRAQRTNGVRNFSTVVTYEPSESGWNEVLSIVPFDQHPQADFGATIVMNSDWIAFSSPYDNTYAESSGSIYIYERDSKVLKPVTKIYCPFPEYFARFGSSIAINDEWMAVTAYGEFGDDCIFVYDTKTFTAKYLLFEKGRDNVTIGHHALAGSQVIVRTTKFNGSTGDNLLVFSLDEPSND